MSFISFRVVATIAKETSYNRHFHLAIQQIFNVSGGKKIRQYNTRFENIDKNQLERWNTEELIIAQIIW